MEVNGIKDNRIGVKYESMKVEDFNECRTK